MCDAAPSAGTWGGDINDHGVCKHRFRLQYYVNSRITMWIHKKNNVTVVIIDTDRVVPGVIALSIVDQN